MRSHNFFDFFFSSTLPRGPNRGQSATNFVPGITGRGNHIRATGFESGLATSRSMRTRPILCPECVVDQLEVVQVAQWIYVGTAGCCGRARCDFLRPKRTVQPALRFGKVRHLISVSALDSALAHAVVAFGPPSASGSEARTLSRADGAGLSLYSFSAMVVVVKRGALPSNKLAFVTMPRKPSIIFSLFADVPVRRNPAWDANDLTARRFASGDPEWRLSPGAMQNDSRSASAVEDPPSEQWSA
jgi:hypothetical protein